MSREPYPCALLQRPDPRRPCVHRGRLLAVLVGDVRAQTGGARVEDTALVEEAGAVTLDTAPRAQ